MNRVLFDYTYYQSGSRFHGGGEYGDVVLNALLERTKDDALKPGLFYRRDRRVNMKLLNLVRENGWNLHPIRDNRNLPGIIKQYGYNTIYSALPYVFNWGSFECYKEVRFVGTFHGFRAIELSFYEDLDKALRGCDEESGLQTNMNYYERALTAFDNTEIVTASTHSKYSLLHFFPQIDEKKIHVFYSPAKLANYQSDPEKKYEFLSKLGVSDKKFGLMVSANYWYKNAKRGIEAYDSVFSGQYEFIPQDYKVVVVGGKENKDDLVRDIRNRERFLFIDYVETEELEILYKHAHLLLYPSLNEGFGYPPIEAMKYGTMCACSANTSISEICRDMVWYFNPLDVNEIAIRILTSFSEEERKKKSLIIEKLLPQLVEKQKNDLVGLVDLITQG